MLMYGRGPSAIAEQLSISVQQAQGIINQFYESFPKVKDYVENVQHQAATSGYVETAYGRKRRLPDMLLPTYEFKIKDATKLTTFDPLDFSDMSEPTISEDRKRYYWAKMDKAYGFQQKQKIKEEAAAEGIEIIDNGGKKADASRQCVNSTIQGQLNQCWALTY